MSAKSTQLELDTAYHINNTKGIEAERPNTSTSFSDIRLRRPGSKDEVWLEVKSDHADNLANPRVFFDGIWQTNYISYTAKQTVELLNESEMTDEFLDDLAHFTNIDLPLLKIPTTRAQFKDLPGVVPIGTMRSFFELHERHRFIANSVNYDIGSMITKCYNDRGIFYMQTGDDFLLVGNSNPLDLPNDIPMLEGRGDFKVRISTRTEFYEIQSQIKIKTLPTSKYSCRPGTVKINPFKG